MYVISNKQLEDIQTFLAAFKSLPAEDNKTFNLKRRAGITIKKLAKAQQINNEQLKRIQDERKIGNSESKRD
jgi:hypothetical protein|nr:MAG TPA_asm: RNA polymerase sigma factor [Caudoviricetes sp.]